MSAGSQLEVLEQQIPGVPTSVALEEEDDAGRGLPDLWIHNGDDWCFLVESKVAAPVKSEQLRRHLATARRNEFTDVNLLVISPSVPSHRLRDVEYTTWIDVHRWMSRQEHRSDWAARFVEYVRIAEDRMAAEGYLGDNSLTEFDGIPFGEDHPYSYREAKRSIRQLMPKLRARRDLYRLGIDKRDLGRGAITGSSGDSVWDYLRLAKAKGEGGFTAHPHLTIAIQASRLLVLVILPHGSKAGYRRNLTGLGLDGFCCLVGDVESDLCKRICKIQRAHPLMGVAQRHHTTRRSPAVTDASLEFDLRTARAGSQDGVKHQVEWLKAAYEALANKKSNLQMGIGAAFPYGSPALQSPQVVNHIADVWTACRPWLRQLLRENAS